MALSQGLRQVQKQTQSLVLAPQLRQSLKILQVPALELRSAILEELQTNPLLEEVGSNDDSLDGEELEPSPDEVSDNEDSEFDDLPDEKIESDETPSDSEDDWDEPAEDLMDLDFSDEFSVLQEMQEGYQTHCFRFQKFHLGMVQFPRHPSYHHCSPLPQAKDWFVILPK